jgi:DNA-nicking Smr family endonuclease
LLNIKALADRAEIGFSAQGAGRLLWCLFDFHFTVKLPFDRRYNVAITVGDVAMSKDDIFQQEMAGVKPLKRQARVLLDRNQRSDKDSSLQERRQAAVEQPGVDKNILSEGGIEPLDAWYVLNFKRPGIQNGVFRKLKQGRYEADASLDLHRMTVAVARQELFAFIEEAQRLGLRTVLLIHGKGESRADREKSSILKGCADHWLPQLPAVQAFHSAQPQHGGTGAVYVLLQKSEEKKRENRIKFNKGRVPYEPDKR